MRICNIMKNRKVLQSSDLCATIVDYKIKEDKSMNTFCINSLRRRERRRKLL